MTAPLLVAAGALAGCAVVAAFDPAQGRYPLCPFRMLTGYWCPACGSLRAAHHLLRGDPASALAFNALAVLALPLLAYAWASWALQRAGRPALPQLRLPAAGWWTLLVAVVAFGVLREAAGLLPAAA